VPEAGRHEGHPPGPGAEHGGPLRLAPGVPGEAHLPVPPGISLPEYDDCCAAAGLTLVDRFATWDADPYEGGGYAVSVHRGPTA
ncbi:hypothetical protein ABZ372_44980, partial [Streptomyces sp. NPDC005921]